MQLPGIFILTVIHSVLLVLASPYLVTLKPTESLDTFLKYEKTMSQGDFKAYISHSFRIGNFSGFFGDLSANIVQKLQKCPLVAELAPDIEIRAFDITTQYDAPRHLARLSQEEKLGYGSFDFIYNSSMTGKHVNAYVIDSGVFIQHPEFEGRARHGIDLTGEGPGDENGHGTHVAGLIGSKTYGVAKSANIIEVKALDKTGSGSLSTIIAAIEFAVNDRKKEEVPGVANLSLGSIRNKILNKAVQAAFETGLVIVAAAGNSNVNACMSSPASAKSAITVGAIDDRSDTLASFSNWGKCVDIFASGTYVASLNIKDEKKAQLLSGTSMASPIVTGLVSTLLSLGMSPFDIKDEILNMAIKNRIPKSSLLLRRKTPNRIAYNGLEGNGDNDRDEYSDSDSDTDSDLDLDWNK